MREATYLGAWREAGETRPGRLTRPSRGPYDVVRLLHEGASYTTYLGSLRGPYGFERQVVLKTPRGDLAGARDVELGLLREATALCRIGHPAVVRLYDFFADEMGDPVLVLEHADGLTLAELLEALDAAGETLDRRGALYAASRVWAALAAAHSARDPVTREFAPVIHREVSAERVLVPWDAFPRLVDFTGAMVAGLAEPGRPSDHRVRRAPSAPEERLGDEITVRTDVYLASVLTRDLAWAGASPPLMRALERGLRKDPDARDLSAAEMLVVLRDEMVEEHRGPRGSDPVAGARIALLDQLARVRESLRADTPPEGRPSSTPKMMPSGVVRRQTAITTPPPDGIRPMFDVPPPPRVPALATLTDMSEVAPLPAAPPPATSRPPTFAPVLAPVLAPALAPGRLAWPTPQAMAHSLPPPPIASTVPVVRPRRGLGPAGIAIAIAAIAAGAIVGGAAGLRITSERAARTSRSIAARSLVVGPRDSAPRAPTVLSATAVPVVPSATATASTTSPRASAEATTPSASSSPKAGRGLLVTGPDAAGHRVFVDGVWAGAGGGGLFVPCGPRTVKIGSAGRPREVTVPCGGELKLTP